MIYGYCRATTPKQIEGDYLEEQENKIQERYFDSIIYKESSLDMNVKPEFNRLMENLKEGDTLVVTSLDRFAKSIEDACNLVKEFRRRKVDLHILNIGLIDNSILGNIIYDTFAAISEFNKALLVERIQTGKNRAKKMSNFREGRPKKYSKETINEALDLLNLYSYRKVEEMTGISKSTLIRAKKAKKIENN